MRIRTHEVEDRSALLVLQHGRLWFAISRALRKDPYWYWRRDSSGSKRPCYLTLNRHFERALRDDRGAFNVTFYHLIIWRWRISFYTETPALQEAESQ